MASVTVPPEYDMRGIAEAAGQPDINKRSYVDGQLVVKDVTQASLNAALLAYDHQAYLDSVDNKKTLAELKALDLDTVGDVMAELLTLLDDKNLIKPTDQTPLIVSWLTDRGTIKDKLK